MKVFQVTFQKVVFTILDYTYHMLQWISVQNIVLHTVSHCNLSYSEQADGKLSQKMKPPDTPVHMYNYV